MILAVLHDTHKVQYNFLKRILTFAKQKKILPPIWQWNLTRVHTEKYFYVIVANQLTARS